MIPIHNLDSVREMTFDEFPNPDGAITDKDQFFVQIGLALAGAGPKQFAEFFARLEVTGVTNLLSLEFILLAYPSGMVAAFLIGLHRFHSIPGYILEFTPLPNQRSHHPI